MKKVVCCLLAVMLVASILAGACAKPAPTPAPAREPIVLKTVLIFAETFESRNPFVELQKKVNERAKGELVIEYVGGPEAIPMQDQVPAVRDGVVDMVFVFGGIYVGVIPGASTLALSTLTAQEERERGYYDFMVEQHKKHNIFYLGRGVNGGLRNFYIWSKVKVERPQDFAGVKIGGLGMAAGAFMKALGTAHFVTPPSEMYTALERGVVDAFWTGLIGPVAMGWAGLTEYFIDHSFYMDNTVFLVNMDSWNSLPKHLQDLMVEAMLEVEQEMPAKHALLQARDRQAMKDMGIEFVKFSEADAKWFLDLAYESEWSKQLEAYAEVTARAKELLAK